MAHRAKRSTADSPLAGRKAGITPVSEEEDIGYGRGIYFRQRSGDISRTLRRSPAMRRPKHRSVPDMREQSTSDSRSPSQTRHGPPLSTAISDPALRKSDRRSEASTSHTAQESKAKSPRICRRRARAASRSAQELMAMPRRRRASVTFMNKVAGLLNCDPTIMRHAVFSSGATGCARSLKSSQMLRLLQPRHSHSALNLAASRLSDGSTSAPDLPTSRLSDGASSAPDLPTSRLSGGGSPPTLAADSSSEEIGSSTEQGEPAECSGTEAWSDEYVPTPATTATATVAQVTVRKKRAPSAGSIDSFDVISVEEEGGRVIASLRGSDDDDVADQRRRWSHWRSVSPIAGYAGHHQSPSRLAAEHEPGSREGHWRRRSFGKGRRRGAAGTSNMTSSELDADVDDPVRKWRSQPQDDWYEPEGGKSRSRRALPSESSLTVDQTAQKHGRGNVSTISGMFRGGDRAKSAEPATLSPEHSLLAALRNSVGPARRKQRRAEMKRGGGGNTEAAEAATLSPEHAPSLPAAVRNSVGPAAVHSAMGPAAVRKSLGPARRQHERQLQLQKKLYGSVDSARDDLAMSSLSPSVSPSSSPRPGVHHLLPSSVLVRAGAINIQNRRLPLANAQQYEEVYRFAVGAILSRVGSVPTTRGLSSYHLLRKLQEMFQVSDAQHTAWVDEENVTANKTSQLVVRVIEARNLASLDPNGYSDPYAVLLVDHHQQKPKTNYLENFLRIMSKSSKAEGGNGGGTGRRRSRSHSPQGGGHHHLLSASLGGGLKEQLARKDSAQFYQTDVVYRSLSPKWDATFKIAIDDVDAATLLLYVVDKDEEGPELPHLIHKKALSNIVESVRSLVKESRDDFMGSVSLPLDTLPAAGCDRWYSLKDMSHDHVTKGEVHLSVHFLPTEFNEDGCSKDNLDLLVLLLKVIYCHVLAVFLAGEKDASPPRKSHSASPSSSPVRQSMDGATAFSIILQIQERCIVEQIQIQLGISDADLTAIKLIAYTSLVIEDNAVPATREAIVGLLLTLRECREKMTKVSDLMPELAKTAMEGMVELADMLIGWGQKIKEVYPPKDFASMDLIESLRALKTLTKVPVFMEYHHFSTTYGAGRVEQSIKSEVGRFYDNFGLPEEFVKPSVCKPGDDPGDDFVHNFSGMSMQSMHCDRMSSGVQVNPEHVSEGPIAFLIARSAVIAEVIASFEKSWPQYKAYEQLFERNEVEYTRTVAEAFAEKMTEEIQLLISMALQHMKYDSHESCDDRNTIMQTLLKLFITGKAMNTATRQVPQIDDDLIPVHTLFKPVMPYFLMTWNGVANEQIAKAIKLDPMDRPEPGSLNSKSAIDVCLVYNRVMNDWKLLADWPDDVTRLTTMVFVVKLICEGALEFTVLSHHRLRTFEQALAAETVGNVEQTAIFRNNIHYVLENLVLRLPRWYIDNSRGDTAPKGITVSFKRLRHDSSTHSATGAFRDACGEEYDAESIHAQCLGTVRRLVTNTEKHMNDCILPTDRALIAKTFRAISSYLKAENVDTAFTVFYETMEKFGDRSDIELSLRKKVMLDIWNMLLEVISQVISKTEKSDGFYQQCAAQLNGCFSALTEIHDSAAANFATDQFKTLQTALHMYSQNSQYLHYQFYMMLRSALPDDKWGSVTIQIAHIPNNVNFSISNLRVNLMHYQGLYSTEDDVDDYAVYFLCQVLPSEPGSPEYTAKSKLNYGTTDLLEVPVNLSIPRGWTQSEGHVLRLSAFHKKRLQQELLGEAIIPLNEVPELGVALYRSLPLRTFNLQMFNIEDGHSVVRCLEQRSRRDAGLKKFMAGQRAWLRTADSVLGHRRESSKF